MLARCYLAAGRISILANYDYSIRTRGNGTNISSQGTTPEKYTTSPMDIARIFTEKHPDAEHAALLRSYSPPRFRRMPQRLRARCVEGNPRRLQAPESGLPVRFAGQRPFATVQGNLSPDQRG